MSIQQFRAAVYQTITKRADATFDLIDALTVAGHVESPVALSEEAPFRRQFSSVYDVLTEGEIDHDQLAPVLHDDQPTDAEMIAGYAVYAVDATPEPRPEAETLADRSALKSDQKEATQVGLKFSWLVRLIRPGTSWVAPQDVKRIKTASTDSQTAVAQIKALDQLSDNLKVAVADSLYANQVFLAVFLVVKTVVALVRLRSNLNLYEQPEFKPQGSRGRPRQHGPQFKLHNPTRPPDRTATFPLRLLTVRLSAWHKLHLRKLPNLVGLVLRVEFLKADGTPRFKRPLWLFWTGPEDVPLPDLCRMYLWRFSIEHAFRFLKQHLGLNANQSTNHHDIELWMWLCVLAYWQLLLIGQDAADLRPAWHPRLVDGQPRPLTPGQVQRSAGRFLAKLGTPAAATRSAGKGHGRRQGHRPERRKRCPVVYKGKKRPNKTEIAPAVAQ